MAWCLRYYIMPPSVCTYSDALHYAANVVLTSERLDVDSRLEQLTELLYSVARSIPSSWSTTTRSMLLSREQNLDAILVAVAEDISLDSDSRKYLVLSSICQLVLTIKQFSVSKSLISVRAQRSARRA